MGRKRVLDQKTGHWKGPFNRDPESEAYLKYRANYELRREGQLFPKQLSKILGRKLKRKEINNFRRSAHQYLVRQDRMGRRKSRYATCRDSEFVQIGSNAAKVICELMRFLCSPDSRVCRHCELSLPLSEFFTRRAGPQSDCLKQYPNLDLCKQCRRDYRLFKHNIKGKIRHRKNRLKSRDRSRWHKQDHKRKKMAAKKRTTQNREFIIEYKSTKSCLDCGGYFHFSAMDFDHARGQKIDDISKMVRKSRDSLMEELAKCDLVCSNCHRLRTWRRHQNKSI